MNTAIPWGYPDTSGSESWAQQYAGWLLLGALVVLAFATAGGGKK